MPLVRLLFVLLLGLAGLACGGVLEDPPAHPSPLAPGLTFKPKARESLIPKASFGFPEPAIGIVKSQCGDLQDGGPVGGPGCITGRIQCDQTIIGHTLGGVQRFDSRFYEKKFCTPYTTNHDSGDERIYRLDMPDGEWTAVVTLDTPCANLDLFAVKWNGEDCPTMSHNLSDCEAVVGNWDRKAVRLVSQRQTSYYVAVEGINQEEGAFSLTVQCRRGLQ